MADHADPSGPELYTTATLPVAVSKLLRPLPNELDRGFDITITQTFSKLKKFSKNLPCLQTLGRQLVGNGPIR